MTTKIRFLQLIWSETASARSRLVRLYIIYFTSIIFVIIDVSHIYTGSYYSITVITKPNDK
jgi:hypothetical protein